MSYHNHHAGSSCPCQDEYAHTSGCGKSRPLGALLLQAEASANPASKASASMSGTTYAVIGALGVAGFLLYRHFKKSGPSTP